MIDQARTKEWDRALAGLFFELVIILFQLKNRLDLSLTLDRAHTELHCKKDV